MASSGANRSLIRRDRNKEWWLKKVKMYNGCLWTVPDRLIEDLELEIYPVLCFLLLVVMTLAMNVLCPVVQSKDFIIIMLYVAKE